MKSIIKNILASSLCNLKLLITRFSNAGFSKIISLKESDFTKENDTCVVIGNGPSLKNDIEKVLKIKNVDFFCVNHMAEFEYFSILKPSKYALLDTYFWAEDAHYKLKVKREALFAKLNESISWNMNIYIPRTANFEYLKKNITNSNIKLIKLDVVPIGDIKYNGIPDILLKGIYGPPACNVIVFSMYLAIIAGYEYIELYGADLSFTEDVVIDQNTNQLLIEYKHFYGESTFEPLLENPQKIVPFTMEALYRTTYLTFYAHNVLNEMALIKGCKVKNNSSYSLIDAYERG
jgi:hypothetical protein